MTQSKLIDELKQTIVDLQSQLDAAKVLLRKIDDSLSVISDSDEHEWVLVNRDVMATISAVAEDRERSGLQGHKDTKKIATCSELIEVLVAIAKWNGNPTLEPGLPTELEQMVSAALGNVV